MKRFTELVLVLAAPLVVVIAALVRPLQGASSGRICRPVCEIQVEDSVDKRVGAGSLSVVPRHASSAMLADPIVRAHMAVDRVDLKSLEVLLRRAAASRPLR